MATKRRPRKYKLDQVDAEGIRETIETRGWKLFAMRVEKLRAAKRLELEQELDAIQTADVRGFLRALNTVSAIPDILMREGAKHGPPDD